MVGLRKLPVSKIRPGQPFAKDFTPKGRTAHVIYAVELREHPGVVKIGRTIRWKNRRASYANWNLASGDAIVSECAFVLTDEYLDLAAIEAAILASCQFPRRHGNEWFHANFDDVCRHIDRFLCEAGLSYDI